MIKQSQEIKQVQKLLPALVMNQNILAIPALALENIIRRELEANPLLEESTDLQEEESGDMAENIQNTEEGVPGLDESKPEISEDAAEENITDNEYSWDEYFENEAEEYKSYDNDVSQSYDYNNISEDNDSLGSSLLLQLHLSELSDKDIFIGEEIIWSLNEEGYFHESYEDILKDLDFRKKDTEFDKVIFSENDIKRVLEYIQINFDPKGIAARNLQECLLIQINRSGKDNETKKHAAEIVENHFDDLRLKRFEIVAEKLNINLEKVSELFDFILKLNPKPGYEISVPEESYIIPDLIVKKTDGNFEISINERFTPSLRINNTYKKMYINGKTSLDKGTKDYLLNNFNKAKWFIEAINSRKETLLKVMTSILENQKEFFENNGEGLKPLYEKDIAESIKMDSSTVSRCVRGKYVQTDFGIYELKSLFSTPFHKNEINTISNFEVKNILKGIIGKEDKSKPLTDEELADEVKKMGYNIARRTVAKYRESLNIPIAKLRREILNKKI